MPAEFQGSANKSLNSKFWNFSLRFENDDAIKLTPVESFWHKRGNVEKRRDGSAATHSAKTIAIYGVVSASV